jgi:hypothetical protein
VKLSRPFGYLWLLEGITLLSILDVSLDLRKCGWLRWGFESVVFRAPAEYNHL